MNIILKEDDITDIDKLDDYNNDYLKMYSDFVPFVTKDNYMDIFKIYITMILYILQAFLLYTIKIGYVN